MLPQAGVARSKSATSCTVMDPERSSFVPRQPLRSSASADSLIQWIMGLGGYMKTWQRQTKDFGHTEGDQYSSLVFDNRGIGESDKPLLRYTTFEMARDVVELLDHVGWTESRSVHVVGISMGGMIAQELVRLSSS